MAIPISIVITAYNREKYLSQAIASVLSQTYRDFELLIWDDGSSDRSLEIARNYAKRDCRIQVVVAEHQGTAAALKAATAKMTGTYLGWVDSDDVLAPTALAETVRILDKYPKVGMVYTDYFVIDESSRIKDYGKRCRIPYSQERLLLDFMTFHFRLIRRCVFNQIGGIDESMVYVEDYDLCLRLSEITKVWHLKKPLYYYRSHESNISKQKRVEQMANAQHAIARAIERRG
jgi:glycosyltransferase involved in cell wall biosynthesis